LEEVLQTDIEFPSPIDISLIEHFPYFLNGQALFFQLIKRDVFIVITIVGLRFGDILFHSRRAMCMAQI